MSSLWPSLSLSAVCAHDCVSVHSWFELIHCAHAAKRNSWWTSIKQKLGMGPPPKIAQRYYPQCLTCCQKQAVAAKANRRTLVVHKAGPKPWHYAGVWTLLSAKLAQSALWALTGVRSWMCCLRASL